MSPNPERFTFIESEDGLFLDEVSQKFRQGIKYGAHGFDLYGTATTFPEIAEKVSAAVDVRYIRSRNMENVAAQYIGIAIAHTISAIRFQIKHSLQRSPDNFQVLTMMGRAVTGGLRNVTGSAVPINNTSASWNNDHITIAWKKESSDANDTRLLIALY